MLKQSASIQKTVMGFVWLNWAVSCVGLSQTKRLQQRDQTDQIDKSNQMNQN